MSKAPGISLPHPEKAKALGSTATRIETGDAPDSFAPQGSELGGPSNEGERYAIGAERGRGGVGRVVEATDRKLDRTVALKQLREGANEERFMREALITARLEHPSIVPIHDFGRWPDGTPYYTMKMVSGRSLAELIGESNSLEHRLSLLPNAIAVADAMAYSHQQGIIHRDLKPANVMVGAFGETLVIDWGLAADLNHRSRDPNALDSGCNALASSLTREGSVLGTAQYMPLEQARGAEVDQRADVYAIGPYFTTCLLAPLPTKAKIPTKCSPTS